MSIASHQEAILHHGEVLWVEGSHKAALGAFRKVILLCSCNLELRALSKKLAISSKDLSLPMCYCKDYMELPIHNLDSPNENNLTIIKRATDPCTCGSNIKPCDNAAHIKALVNIANVHGTQHNYDMAKCYASLAITLAPHLPEGYLRMVTVIRQGSLPCKPNIPTRCNWFDTQASHNVRAYGDKNHKMLQPIGRRIRRDIIRDVPAEVRQMILNNLSHKDVCRAMRVSQVWHLACRDRHLWKDLHIIKTWKHTIPRLPLRPGTLNNIIKLSGNMATSLTISGLRDFRFDGPKLRAMLKALPELKTLSLAGRHDLTHTDDFRPLTPNCPRFSDFWAAVCEDAPPTLTTLHLSSFNLDSVSWDPQPLCRLTKSLKELSLVRLNPVSANLVIDSVMQLNPHTLKTLIVKGCDLEDRPLNLCDLISRHAFLRTVTLDGVSMEPKPRHVEIEEGLSMDSNLQNHVALNQLERVVLGKFYPGGMFPTSEMVRCLELNVAGLFSLNALMWTTEVEKPFLPRLEHFRCHFDPHATNLELFQTYMASLSDNDPYFALLRPSIENGTLRSLDLTFDSYMKAAIDQLFEESQKDTICTLSCHEVAMPSIVTGYGGTCNEFLDWIDTFPNLRTVGAFPQKTENAHMLISSLMDKRPNIKTIYTNVLKGADRDKILARADKKHITIIHADRVPEPLLEPLRESQALVNNCRSSWES